MVDTTVRDKLFGGHLSVPLFAVYFGVYFGLCIIAFALRSFPGEPALIWPAAGLYLPTLAMLRLRYWPIIVTASYIAELIAEFVWSGTLDSPLTFVFSGINAVEAMIGGLIFAWLVPAPWHRRQSLELIAFLVLCGVLAPMIGALLSAQVIQITTGSFSEAVAEFRYWWSGDFLGIMLVAPVLGGVVLHSTAAAPIPRAKFNVAIVLGTAVAAILLLLLGTDAMAGTLSMPFRFGLALVVLLAALAWFSANQEPIIVAFAAFVFTLTISACMVVPGSQFRIAIGQNRALVEAVQLFVFASSLSAFIVSITLFERRYVRRLLELRQSAAVLMSDIATQLSNCEPERLDSEIETTLEAVGKYADADRCMILDENAGDKSFSQTYRWVRPGVTDTKPLATNIPVEIFAGLIGEIRVGRSRFLRRGDFPRGDPARNFLESAETRAALYSPLVSDEQVSGALALIWVRRDIRTPGDLVMVLQSLGQAIGKARKRLQTDEATKTYQDRLRRLAAELNRVDDKVRRETAIDLHDGAAQQLAVSRIKLGQLREASPNSEEALVTVDNMVADALAQIRNVIDKLTTTALYDLGLSAALDELATNISREFGIRVTFITDLDELGISEDLSAVCYRAARELLINAIKHADATDVQISLSQQGKNVILEVRDNGSGIDLVKPNEAGQTGSGMGLFNMRAQAGHLGGHLEIDSGAGGTTVTLALPLND